jgi:hypothetical protein
VFEVGGRLYGYYFEGYGSLGSRVACECWWEVTRKRIGLRVHLLWRKVWMQSSSSLTSVLENVLVVKSNG